jgi:hypothetical protein
VTSSAALQFVKGLLRPVAVFAFPKLVYRRMLYLEEPEPKMDLLPVITAV